MTDLTERARASARHLDMQLLDELADRIEQLEAEIAEYKRNPTMLLGKPAPDPFPLDWNEWRYD